MSKSLKHIKKNYKKTNKIIIKKNKKKNYYKIYKKKGRQ